MAAPAARSVASRFRRLIAFVAIVWGVAATFVLFELVSLNAVDLALSYPAVFGNIALSRTVTESTSCIVRPGEQPEREPPAASASDARVDAWLLGVSLGRDAVFRQFANTNPETLEQTAAGLRALADRLGVPAPSVFRAKQLAVANIEFVPFVERDETAHRLAVAFSAQTCELYKLGALWGYSEMLRPLLPGERAIFAMEIRHHAQRAGLQEPLWSPMLQRIPADARPADVIAQMEDLTDGVATHLAGRR